VNFSSLVKEKFVFKLIFKLDSTSARLPEYLFGLKCNQRAARFWFPDWNLRLYIDSSVHENESVFNYLFDICEYGEPKIEMIPCRYGFNPTIERYRPFFEPNINVCLARDVDSILSKTDADYVKCWLDGKYGDVDILCYREYMQDPVSCMGGGISVKCPRFLGSNLFHSTPEFKYLRGVDEKQLERLLSRAQAHHIITKMTGNGVYSVVDDTTCKPSDSQLLWTIPFFDTLNGYAHEYENCNWLNSSSTTIDQIVEFVKTLKIKREHIGAHWIQHSSKILLNTTLWIR
jgi:hypothetical protein